MKTFSAAVLSTGFAALLGWFGPVALDHQPTPSTIDAIHAAQVDARMDKAARAICEKRGYQADENGAIICN